jgi:pyruvate kinase
MTWAAKAVQTLAAIIMDAEAIPQPDQARSSEALHDNHAQALCEAAVTLANRGDAQAIVAVTRGGGTARLLSALRPHAPIFAATDRDDMARRLAMYWGVSPVVADVGDSALANLLIGQQLVARGLLTAGSAVVLVSISPDLARQDANYLKLQRL